MQLEGFTEVSEILRCGVYVLVLKGRVVYVGKSKSMLVRVYTHRQVWSAKRRGKVPDWLNVKGILFDAIYVQPCAEDRVDALERQMIDRFRPEHNILVSMPIVPVTRRRIGGSDAPRP